MNKSVWLVFTVLVLIACQEEAIDRSENDDGLYEVSGKVENIGTNGSTTEITLRNSAVTYTSHPSENGDYTLTNVIGGTYTMRIFQTHESGTVERSLDIKIGNSDTTVNVFLPNPVMLTSEAHSSKSVTLNWNVCSDPAFREYKIYKGHDAGLDETTGTLLFVSTNARDTTVVDSTQMMNPNSDYYYRIFVMDERGKLAGSNVLHVKTDPQPELYKLTLVRNAPASGTSGQIAGVAFDGTYLWAASRMEIGGFYDNDLVTLTKYDTVDFSIVQTFTYNDRYDQLGGLAFDGQYLWLQYQDQNNLIYKINRANGERIASYATAYGVWGLSSYNSELYLSQYYRKVEKWNPLTAEVINTYNSDFGDAGGNYGIAAREGEIWISIRLNTPSSLGIGIFNSDFSLKGLVKNPWDFGQLCFVNGRLLIARPDRFYFYKITKN